MSIVISYKMFCLNFVPRIMRLMMGPAPKGFVKMKLSNAYNVYTESAEGMYSLILLLSWLLVYHQSVTSKVSFMLANLSNIRRERLC